MGKEICDLPVPIDSQKVLYIIGVVDSTFAALKFSGIAVLAISP